MKLEMERLSRFLKINPNFFLFRGKTLRINDIYIYIFKATTDPPTKSVTSFMSVHEHKEKFTFFNEDFPDQTFDVIIRSSAYDGYHATLEQIVNNRNSLKNNEILRTPVFQITLFHSLSIHLKFQANLKHTESLSSRAYALVLNSWKSGRKSNMII